LWNQLKVLFAAHQGQRIEEAFNGVSDIHQEVVFVNAAEHPNPEQEL
jgi:hypothetical protein